MRMLTQSIIIYIQRQVNSLPPQVNSLPPQVNSLPPQQKMVGRLKEITWAVRKSYRPCTRMKLSTTKLEEKTITWKLNCSSVIVENIRQVCMLDLKADFKTSKLTQNWRKIVSCEREKLLFRAGCTQYYPDSRISQNSDVYSLAFYGYGVEDLEFRGCVTLSSEPLILETEYLVIFSRRMDLEFSNASMKFLMKEQESISNYYYYNFLNI